MGARLFSGMMDGNKIYIGSNSGSRFSQWDRKIGYGYLVHADRLYYQRGKEQRMVGDLRTTNWYGVPNYSEILAVMPSPPWYLYK